jgi:uncharacterized protein YeaO (DUF488 family)
MIKLERAYDRPACSGGACFLVERLWPRGVRKTDLQMDGWLKEAAPSTELRKWFGHDPARWAEFRARYFRELDAHPEAWAALLEAARRGDVTLIFSSHDVERNNAVALRDYLESKLKRKARARSHPAKKAA